MTPCSCCGNPATTDDDLCDRCADELTELAILALEIMTDNLVALRDAQHAA